MPFVVPLTSIDDALQSVARLVHPPPSRQRSFSVAPIACAPPRVPRRPAQATRHNHVVVNGHPPAMKYRGYLQPADVVSPGSGSRGQFIARIARSLGPDIVNEAKRAMVG